jgi:hypothetical protein
MPEDVSDIFETRSAAYHGCGQRVAEDVSSGAWSADPRSPQQSVHNLGHEPVAAQRQMRGLAPEKNRPFGADWTRFVQIAG